MKKFLLLTLVVLMFSTQISAQDFDNGIIGVSLSAYGRVRVVGPTLDTRQIDRSSILIGHVADQVFDYWNDADNVDTARTIATPAVSDYEAYVSIDNAYSQLPPAAMVKINAYGWDSEGFLIVRFRVFNTESSDWMNTLIGMEVIPQLDGVYGFETHQWVYPDDVMDIYSGSSTHVGYKILSAPMASMTTFDWYSGYNSVDADLWGWLNYSGIDTLYECLNADGTVAVFKQGGVNITAGDSVDMFIGIAIGSDQPQMLTNMSAAVTKYTDIFTTTSVQIDNPVPMKFKLEQNYPNPFNPETKIVFNLPETGHVRLNVYNMLGQEVASLVDEQLSAGIHESVFDATNLPSGIYFYTIQTGEFSATRKMVLIK